MFNKRTKKNFPSKTVRIGTAKFRILYRVHALISEIWAGFPNLKHAKQVSEQGAKKFYSLKLDFMNLLWTLYLYFGFMKFL